MVKVPVKQAIWVQSLVKSPNFYKLILFNSSNETRIMKKLDCFHLLQFSSQKMFVYTDYLYLFVSVWLYVIWQRADISSNFFRLSCLWIHLNKCHIFWTDLFNNSKALKHEEQLAIAKELFTWCIATTHFYPTNGFYMLSIINVDIYCNCNNDTKTNTTN